MFVVAVAKIHIIIELLHDCRNVLMQFNNNAILTYCNIAVERDCNLMPRRSLPLLLDCGHGILGEKTNLRLSEGRDACIDG